MRVAKRLVDWFFCVWVPTGEMRIAGAGASQSQDSCRRRKIPGYRYDDNEGSHSTVEQYGSTVGCPLELGRWRRGSCVCTVAVR